MNMRRVLSTKKLLPTQKQYLLNAGFSVIEADFIEIKYKNFDIDSIAGDLIFTSGNAVRSFIRNTEANRFKSANNFCVGEKTCALLRESGFNVAGVADNAAALGDMIMENIKGAYTFLSGNLRLDTLPMSLRINGAKFREVEVYETRLKPLKMNLSPDALLFFSPSGVKSYLAENLIGDAICFCIGATTSEALPESTKVVVANKPSVENVIIQCINHFKHEQV